MLAWLLGVKGEVPSFGTGPTAGAGRGPSGRGPRPSVPIAVGPVGSANELPANERPIPRFHTQPMIQIPASWPELLEKKVKPARPAGAPVGRPRLAFSTSRATPARPLRQVFSPSLARAAAAVALEAPKASHSAPARAAAAAAPVDAVAWAAIEARPGGRRARWSRYRDCLHERVGAFDQGSHVLHQGPTGQGRSGRRRRDTRWRSGLAGGFASVSVSRYSRAKGSLRTPIAGASPEVRARQSP